MSKIYKVFILLFMFGIQSYAQNALEIYNLEGRKIENATKMYSYIDGSSTKVLYTDSLIVKNVYSDLLNIKVRKTEKTIIESTFNVFTALSQNVSVSENITPAFVSLNPGETLNQDDYFLGSYFHRGNKGTSVICYSFLAYDISEELVDSVYVEYYYKNTSIILLSQSNQLFPKGEVMVTGDPDEIVEFPIHLYNQNSIDISVQAEKNVILSEENHEVYFRLNNIEYGVDENVSSEEGASILAQDTLLGENSFVAIFNANGTDSNLELTKVRYLFHDITNIADSNSITLIFNPSGVGFDEISGLNISKPYPNPAADFFTIDHPSIENQNFYIKIYNAEGKLISLINPENNTQNTLISTKGFRTGIYFISVEIDGQPKGVEKIIIQ